MYQKIVKATKARTLARFRNTVKNLNSCWILSNI